MTKKAAKKKNSPRSAGESPVTDGGRPAVVPLRPHPRLFVLSVIIFALWLVFLAYVAWRA
jgi:hypothetical protein